MTKTKFEKWYEEADMPMKDKYGRWYDGEDGRMYNEQQEVYKPERTTLSNKALTARGLAKKYGGKALTGTAKQKEWAEKIRYEKLVQLTEEDITLLCNPNHLLRFAWVWIKNKDKAAKEFVEFIKEISILKKQINELRENAQYDKSTAIAAIYNNLTTKWGFE